MLLTTWLWLHQCVSTGKRAAPSASGWVTHLVGDFDEEAEALRGLQEQPVGDVLAEVLGFRAGFHLKCL